MVELCGRSLLILWVNILTSHSNTKQPEWKDTFHIKTFDKLHNIIMDFAQLLLNYFHNYRLLSSETALEMVLTIFGPLIINCLWSRLHTSDHQIICDLRYLNRLEFNRLCLFFLVITLSTIPVQDSGLHSAAFSRIISLKTHPSPLCSQLS